MNVLKKYIWLVDTILRAGEKGLTLEQIGELWDRDDAMHDNGAFSNRSFHRHRSEILDVFGIEIECYNSGIDYRYRIADDGKNDYFRRWMMDAIAVNRIVADSREVSELIAVESSQDSLLPVLLEALKTSRMVSFDYKPYWADHTSHYFNFMSFALKMFERRWYLIGKYDATKPCKIYALDRMSNVELQEENYVRDSRFDVSEMFDGTYGIIIDDAPVESVWLKVDAYQANFVRSLPLHKSQHEIKRNDRYSVFALRVRPTFDFKQKILSLGATVEVLKPQSLRDDIRGEINEMINKYKDDDD